LFLFVLQIVDWIQLKDAQSIFFFRTLFQTLLTQFPEAIVEKVFQRVHLLNDPTVVGLREGMAHFLLQNELYLKTRDSSMTPEQKALTKKMKMARKILQNSTASSSFDMPAEFEDEDNDTISLFD
jgi:hypothetical protein